MTSGPAAIASERPAADGPATAGPEATTGARDAAAADEAGLGSTREIAAPGGSHVMAVHVPVAELPEVTDVAVRARVAHIGESRLNTVTGSWDPPEDASASELHDQYAELLPLTDVTLTVSEVLGARPASSLEVEPGDDVVVTILGGDHAVTLTAEQARAIGLSVPRAEPGGAGPPDGPLDLRVTMAPAVDLSVADDVIAFLNPYEMRFYPGPVVREVVVSVRPDGWGLYALTEAGGPLVDAASGREVAASRLEAAARSLDRQEGPRRAFTGSGR